MQTKISDCLQGPYNTGELISHQAYTYMAELGSVLLILDYWLCHVDKCCKSLTTDFWQSDSIFSLFLSLFHCHEFAFS